MQRLEEGSRLNAQLTVQLEENQRTINDLQIKLDEERRQHSQVTIELRQLQEQRQLLEEGTRKLLEDRNRVNEAIIQEKRAVALEREQVRQGQERQTQEFEFILEQPHLVEDKESQERNKPQPAFTENVGQIRRRGGKQATAKRNGLLLSDDYRRKSLSIMHKLGRMAENSREVQQMLEGSSGNKGTRIRGNQFSREEQEGGMALEEILTKWKTQS